MTNARKMQDLERWFDGDLPADAFDETTLETDAELAAHYTALKGMRGALRGLGEAPELADAQMPAYLAELKNRAEAPSPMFRGWMTFASLAASPAPPAAPSTSHPTITAPG